jgi:asparagine synthase (glutamine-hydrolysing)
MCGIAGWFDLGGERAPDRAALNAMNNAIAHRGPDGEGLYLRPGIGLAHRRLAVIDLETGMQPMQDEGGTATIGFNGEIYNFRAVRDQLEALGHVFHTKSDTEVILKAWKQWGEDCVCRLSGMFAFAIWDARERCLFLARDRLGEKPLYYATLPDHSFIFASEIGALLTNPRLIRTIDARAVEEFFALGYIAEPRTIYGTILKLPAACSLVIRREQPPRMSSYWDITLSSTGLSDTAGAASELTGRLDAAVEQQMVSDVPIGAFLSGGVDSGMTTALMARHSAAPVRCFTIGFTDPRFDESSLAAEVAARYGARHCVQTVAGTEDDLVHELPGIFGEPFGDSSAIPCLRLMRLARQHVTVALSGDGGDELFAGYRRYAFHQREEKIRGLLPQGLRGPAFGLLGRLYPQLDWLPRLFRAKQTFLELSRDTLGGYFANVSVTDDRLRARLFSPRLRSELQGYHASEVIGRHLAKAPFESPVAKAQYVDLKTWLPGDILTKVDRTAMACGLEVRVPMLDPGLVQWAVNLPEQLQISDGKGKAALRRAAAAFLPQSVMSRPKQGFSVPLAAWFRGKMGRAFEREISQGAASGDYLEPREVATLLEQHRLGVRDHSRVLWLCWMFEKFMRDVHYAFPAAANAGVGDAGKVSRKPRQPSLAHGGQE